MHQGMTFIVGISNHVYNLVGNTSQVKELNHDAKTARVVRADVNYITSPR